jgi:zinc protease
MKKLLSILLLTLSPGLFAEVVEFNLANGLHVLVKPDHRAPIAITMVWYKVGSADEIGGQTGLSHALEHMMFKGTPTIPAGKFSQIIAGHGGQDNAFTNQDYTAYYEKISAPALNTALRLEADRMSQLNLSAEEFSKEIQVIKEERRLRVDNNPQALTVERFDATAYLSPAYQHPIIGWMSDLEHLHVETLRKWYQQYYTPNNATLVIVGDVDPEKVKARVEHYFGHIQQHMVPQRFPQEEPKPLGNKQVELHTLAQQPILLMGFTTPSLGYLALSPQKDASATDPYALEVIAGILDAGGNGRLTKSVVNTQHIAVVANAYYDLYTRYQTQFMLFAIPATNHTLGELKNAFLQEMNHLKTSLISPQELKRIQTQLIAQKTFAQDSLFGQAMEMGLVETIGLNYHVIDEYNAHVLSITPEQIMTCAKKYFCDTCLTEAQLYPKSSNLKR